jgi:hypothetical protein
VELNRLNGKIKDCLSKGDLTEFQNQHEILAGKMMQQVLEEANRELQSSIAEIKRDIECKVLKQTACEIQIMITNTY